MMARIPWTSLTPNSPRPGIIKFFSSRERLVRDIPVGGTGKTIIIFFYSVGSQEH